MARHCVCSEEVRDGRTFCCDACEVAFNAGWEASDGGGELRGSADQWGVLDAASGQWMAPFDLGKSFGLLWAEDVDGARLFEHAAYAQEAVTGMPDLQLTVERIRITDGVREHVKREPATTKAQAMMSFPDDTPKISALVDLGCQLLPPKQTINRDPREEIRVLLLALYGRMYLAADVTVTFDDECHDCGAYRPDGVIGCENPKCPLTE